MGTDSSRKCSGSNPDGIRESGRSGGNAPGRHPREHENIPSMVSMGGARPKKPKMEIQIHSKEQQLGGQMGTLTIPDKEEWGCYLTYLYYRYEQIVGEPDLRAYEDLENDSE